MNWNHRIVKINDATTNETLYMVAEVFYNDDGTPAGYTAPFVHSESIDGLTDILNQMQTARLQPVLNAEDMIYAEQDMDDDDVPMTREDVIAKLSNNYNVVIDERLSKLLDIKPGECPLCGNPENCEDCK